MRNIMTKTVVALYDDPTDARTVERELSDAGFTDVEVIDSSHLSAGWTSGGILGSSTPGTGSAVGSGGDGALAASAPGVAGAPLGTTPVAGRETDATLGERAAGLGSGAGSESGILSRLHRAGVPEDEAHVYAEGVRRGGSLVIARLADENVDRGLEIMSN
jgi:hypothetical protein